MSFIGIDIGTGSVRAYLVTGGRTFTDVIDISRRSHLKFSNYITQSSGEVLQAVLNTIQSVLTQSGCSKIDGVSVAATCSMVTFEKSEDGQLLPYPCDFDKACPDQNIILWMDSRSQRETEFINNENFQSELDKVGGKFIPEMGLPKLKWLSNNKGHERLVVYELHDYITSMLLKRPVEIGIAPFSPGALDGSFKGIDPRVLKRIGVQNVEICGSERGNSLYPLGTPIGLLVEGGVVSVGCIDCYAGWIATISLTPRAPLYMIAGTSTCFLLPTERADVDSIGGVWGPFNLLQNNFQRVYESGQPATGRLYESLFDEYLEVIPVGVKNIFDWLELETCQLEKEFNSSIDSLIKYYFYYGDLFGNRCPYNDPAMSCMMIDGCNSSPGLPSIWVRTKVSLVIRFNLIREFLCFQTMEIIESFPPGLIESIVVSGSQLQNHNFWKN